MARYRGAEEQIKALREEADTWRGRLEDLSKKVQEIQEEYDNLQPACDNAKVSQQGKLVNALVANSKLALKKLGEKRHKGKTAIEYWTKYRARIEGEHKEAEAVLQQLQAEADVGRSITPSCFRSCAAIHRLRPRVQRRTDRDEQRPQGARTEAQSPGTSHQGRSAAVRPVSHGSELSLIA